MDRSPLLKFQVYFAARASNWECGESELAGKTASQSRAAQLETFHWDQLYIPKSSPVKASETNGTIMGKARPCEPKLFVALV